MRVIFPIVKEENKIVYPDNIEFFSNTETKGNDIIADYSGSLALTEYVPGLDPIMISNTAFWDRFLETEQENLLDSANKKIKRFLYELRIRPEFNLLDSKLISAINALESASIIGAGRTDEILN